MSNVDYKSLEDNTPVINGVNIKWLKLITLKFDLNELFRRKRKKQKDTEKYKR